MPDSVIGSCQVNKDGTGHFFRFECILNALREHSDLIVVWRAGFDPRPLSVVEWWRVVLGGRGVLEDAGVLGGASIFLGGASIFVCGLCFDFCFWVVLRFFF